MHEKERSERKEPLTRRQAEDVLRYWLLSLQLEEALTTRPRARRASPQLGCPRLDVPTPGQEYFKLPLDAQLAALFANDSGLTRAMDSELAQFFETWLYGQYRRGDEERELSHLLCFPVVHLPRGELTGLLRCGVRLRFAEALGTQFRVPSWAERRRGQYGKAPDLVRVTRAPRAERAWPYFVDTRLLAYPLGVSSESMDALFDALRSEEIVSECRMISLVIAVLEHTSSDHERDLTASSLAEAAHALPERDDLCALLSRLTRAVHALLESSSTRAKVYAVGLVLDGTRTKTTWHLQRELSELLESAGDGGWKKDSALGAYLTGNALAAGDGLQRALFPGPSLTRSQRAAADAFWGSKLTSVQGPPGTGKTRLILHLCAEALVRQVETLIDTGSLGEQLFVVTSSNNRAVDNVIDPLTEGEELPLALRVGSRQVCEQVLAATLRGSLTFLTRARSEPLPTRLVALEQALASFSAARAELAHAIAPRVRALHDASKRRRIHAALSAQTRSASTAEQSPSDPRLRALTDPQLKSLLPLVAAVEQRLERLSNLCDVKPGLAQVNAVARHYGRTAARTLPPLEAALLEAGLTLELPLPPVSTPTAVGELMQAWSEASEDALSRVVALRKGIEREREERARITRLTRLQGELTALGPEPSAEVPIVDHDELAQEVFRAAVRVRNAWARVHADDLCNAVATALAAVEQERSLRPFFRDHAAHGPLFRRLFGIWGCTLLSLGNVCEPEALSIDRVVIDEAGQCHPAHALSALLRCESALVIGDVHQLAPVSELAPDDEARVLAAARLTTPLEALTPYRTHGAGLASAQSLAERAVDTRRVLVDHFRCQPEIIAVSNALCGYGLTVHTPREHRQNEAAFLHKPLLLVDVRGTQERLSGSLCNEAELRETLALVQSLLAARIAPHELAVITPYRGQLERLRRSFAELRIPTEYSPELSDAEGPSPRETQGVALGTVHRFQGGERSIVLFSSVVTRTASLGFLNERPNLLNVAVSRARHHFVCVGDRSVLASGPLTRLLTDAAWPMEPRTPHSMGAQIA